jgi:peptidoglycan/xylan/chitin deacetylase (PgdA/CDA1 family)
VLVMVALTFDDGPDPTWTAKVLGALHEAGIKATFFIVADQIQDAEEPKEDAPALIAKIKAEGHAIQLHCGTHETHVNWCKAQIRADADRALDMLASQQVDQPCLWRPPQGDVNSHSSCQVAGDLGLQLVRWTWNTRDCDGLSTDEMFAAACAAPFCEDSVILMHDATRYAERNDCQSTVDLIPRLVAYLRTSGFELGPLTAPIATRPLLPGEETLLPCEDPR